MILASWLMRCYNTNVAPVAQWIERLTTNQEVAGSSPTGRTTFCLSLLHFPPSGISQNTGKPVMCYAQFTRKVLAVIIDSGWARLIKSSRIAFNFMIVRSLYWVLGSAFFCLKIWEGSG